MSVIIAHDATHENVSRLPHGQTCGYTTGSASVRWTDADWKLHPQAVRIDQDAAASDPSADVLDVERGAATTADCPVWVKKARDDYARVVRPGQREPAIYFSASSVHDVVNALVGGGIKSGVGLWIAEWALDNAQAVADVQNAAGPFPIIGVQYSSGQFFDTNVFSSSWLANVSAKAPAPGAPFRHLTAKGDTIASLAAARGMTPKGWVELQDHLGADVDALAAGPLPAGVTWLSVNP